jgi:hypothetical protein
MAAPTCVPVLHFQNDRVLTIFKTHHGHRLLLLRQNPHNMHNWTPSILTIHLNLCKPTVLGLRNPQKRVQSIPIQTAPTHQLLPPHHHIQMLRKP